MPEMTNPLPEIKLSILEQIDDAVLITDAWLDRAPDRLRQSGLRRHDRIFRR